MGGLWRAVVSVGAIVEIGRVARERIVHVVEEAATDELNLDVVRVPKAAKLAEQVKAPSKARNDPCAKSSLIVQVDGLSAGSVSVAMMVTLVAVLVRVRKFGIVATRKLQRHWWWGRRIIQSQVNDIGMVSEKTAIAARKRRGSLIERHLAARVPSCDLARVQCARTGTSNDLGLIRRIRLARQVNNFWLRPGRGAIVKHRRPRRLHFQLDQFIAEKPAASVPSLVRRHSATLPGPVLRHAVWMVPLVLTLVLPRRTD